ncbi:sigma-54-dependent Fis family transcriptional regulator [Nitrincola tibetensis]|uniref:Sigma-54-dependent Fis family transcriptional regulator n=1 Tax=Nitrincola tibetensis TaxID=2219697 RepID=A0A364NIK9_9GAMM|nr:sigma-54 dependent transcriptional regulator [Nitrincola tibetensis]RAU16968.1 sigma-54-dependent Fis family transcriptional regulator [Nitrincola tibetensis]
MSAAQVGATVLVLEDDKGLAALIADELDAQGYTPLIHYRLQDALQALSHDTPSLIVTDLRLPDGKGMDLVRFVNERWSESERPGLIVITAFGSVKQAVEALQAGADDFITKPLDMDHFLLSVHKTLQTRQLQDELHRYRKLSKDKGFHDIFGSSQVMRNLFNQIKVIARAQGPVLIVGESGTGKELVAKAIHAESDRAQGPFLAVNCAGIPQDLLESEFFGHAVGAFTGAKGARKGLLQEANGGTLLLDEIGEMPLTLQAKLLRALQDGSIRPVGQDTEEHVDVRVLAATHRDLLSKVSDGSFREDLYYRLETFSLTVPALREREDDLEALAARFMQTLAISQQKPIQGFSKDALALIKSYDFPGNVRELQNVIERAVTFCSHAYIQVDDLPSRLLNPSKVSTQDESHVVGIEHQLLSGRVLPTLEELQRRYINHVLNEVDGNKRRAAALLGIGRRTLYRWLDEDE